MILKKLFLGGVIAFVFLIDFGMYFYVKDIFAIYTQYNTLQSIPNEVFKHVLVQVIVATNNISTTSKNTLWETVETKEMSIRMNRICKKDKPDGYDPKKDKFGQQWKTNFCDRMKISVQVKTNKKSKSVF